MGQSLVQNYLHIVFGTKFRVPLITPQVEQDLHAYVIGICGNLECPTLRVGGYHDHLHILCMLSKNLTVVELVKEIKGSSSSWIKTTFSGMSDFYWQGGYAAFSVSRGHVERVITYIKNQHEHHKKEAYKKELMRLLDEHGVMYDERYLWN